MEREPSEISPACLGTHNKVDAQVSGLVVQAGTIMGGVRVEFRQPVDVDEAVVRDLRRQVRDQWTQEVAVRGLRQPRPLCLRWRLARDDICVPSPGDVDDAGVRGSLVQDVGDVRPVAHALVEQFARDPREQLVVVGEAGAGKSTLVMFYAVAVIELTDIAPLLFSVAGWDPVEPITDWVTRRIAEDYPPHDQMVIQRLLFDRRIVPILDGLDELPIRLLQNAVAELDRAAARGLPMILTCRGAEFAHAVAAAGALAAAAVVELEPITAADAAVFLSQPETSGVDRWAPVVVNMRAAPEGTLARALATPLMISLARQVYRRPADPGELTRFVSAEAIERHLLDQFIPTVYQRDDDRKCKQRWLTFLAHHLTHRMNDPNFEWWHLARAVPRRVIACLVVAVTTCFGAALSLTLLAMGDRPTPGVVLNGAVVGYVLGVVTGVRTGRAAHTPRRPEPRRFVLTIFRDVLRDVAALITAACGAFGVLLAGVYAADRSTAVTVSNTIMGVIRSVRAGNTEAIGGILLVLVVLISIAVVMNALAANRGGRPHRSKPSWRRLISSLLLGVGSGLLVSPVVVVMAVVTDLPLREAAAWELVLVGLIGVPIGVVRWFATPAEQASASAPEVLLRQDRAALIGTVLVSAFASFTVTGLVIALVLMESAADIGYASAVSLVVSACTATVVLFGSGSAWMTYVIARFWLAAWGRLPWRLGRFLREARTVGVLRQVGPGFQLRHEALRAHLADQWLSPSRLSRLVEAPAPLAQKRSSAWRPLTAVVTSAVFAAGVTYLVHLGVS